MRRGGEVLKKKITEGGKRRKNNKRGDALGGGGWSGVLADPQDVVAQLQNVGALAED